MFDAEKRILELVLKGKKAAKCRHDSKNAIWYLYEGLAFRPAYDFMVDELFKYRFNNDSILPFVLKDMLENWIHYPFHDMEPQKTIDDPIGKLVPMQDIENPDFVQYYQLAYLKPWLNKNHHFVLSKPDSSPYPGGVLLVLKLAQNYPVAFVNMFRKEE